MDQKVTRQAAKAAGMISIMFLISRILGFVRESLSGSQFTRFQTDSFFAAFIIPDTMYYLLVGGALSAAFIPVFNEYLTKGEEEEGWKMTSTFINIVGLFLIALTILGICFTKWITPLEAPHFQAAKMGLLISLTKIMFPAVCFTALAGLMGGVLNSYRRFLGPALGPNIYNIGIILGAVLLGSRFGIQGMAIGVLVGAVANFLTQLFFLPQCGGRYYRFGYIDLKNPGFQKMLILWVPALIGLSADQVNIWATTAMASALNEGGITAIRFATRLIQLPIGIFAAGISMAFFPLLSSLVTEKKMDQYKDTLSLSLRTIFFIMIPAGIGLIILKRPIVELLFERQKFTPADTMLTASALGYYSLAVFAHAAILMLPRAFYALQNTRTPVIVSFISVSASIFFNWLFLTYTKLGVRGFGISFTIMGLLNMILLMLILRHKIGGMRGRQILKSFIKSAIASLVMGAVIMLFVQVVNHFVKLNGHLEAALLIVFGMVVGGFIYLLFAWLLKMEELNMLLAQIRKRLPLKSN
ncbi:MAG TPA: murein biosynthesis integral membrane protein MurJ [Firmicutes bacterium]|nr:murein biosynthesis integral membrane protein MurJ [Bacillota bacterium]